MRLYPLWHWQHRVPLLVQPVEPSLFVGLGAMLGGFLYGRVHGLAYLAMAAMAMLRRTIVSPDVCGVVNGYFF